MYILLSLLLLFQSQMPLSEVDIVLNDEMVEFEEAAYIKENRTIVPIKFLMNALGYQVSWDPESRTVYCERGESYIEMVIDSKDIIIDGEIYQSDVAPTIINSRTYVPLALISRSVGADVRWDGDTRTVYIDEKLDYVHYFYGSGSYQNYTELDKSNIQSIAYAWSKVQVTDGIVNINTSSKDNQMYVPSGYELAMDHQGDKLLNIYCDSQYDILMVQNGVLIENIKRILNGVEDVPEFDGVIIDFESIPQEHYENYYIFLENLRAEISQKIFIAVQPRAFDYHVLLNHVDGVILMLHDYESKDDAILNFSKDYVYQPMASIENIKNDLDRITEGLSYTEKSKLLLQVNLAVVQWQGESLLEVKRYTPNYNLLISRLETLEADKFFFNPVAAMPYVTYIDENMLYNTIWYENQASIDQKIKLIFDYDLGGLSLWHIGNIPRTQEFDLDIIETIMENTH